ncbi:MAG: flagellar biosynthesis protein FlhA [Candidatus Kapabacteria bacterium]|nr:flagellar biosynthesis protein FlhA [Candidatus Kapabacteria bacterium]
MAQETTAPQGGNGFTAILARLNQHPDILLALGVLVVVALLIVPLSPFMLDMFLGLGLAISVLILMVSVYLTSPLEMSSFPTVLLVTTLFRLGMNIASTRLILGEGTAGDIIHAFGSFVVGGNFVVGIIIFLILLVINFVVVIKGSTRIAEVAARFTLDALPGKQMSIDADLNAGFIDEKEARRRRELLQREAEFNGAMDGAAKFVKGDAIAAIIITAINIIGGFTIGVLQRDMDVASAIKTYTILTVGDGLVSQIPALIISVAAGLLITRSSSGEKLEKELSSQFGTKTRPLFVASGVMASLGLLPGFPFLPFALLGTSIGAIAYFRMQSNTREENQQMREQLAAASAEKKEKEEQPVEDLLRIDPVEVEIGYGLIPLVDESQGGDVFKRITNIRKQLATELGLILPPVRVRDNLALEPEEYIVKLRGNIIARNRLLPSMLLAMNPGTADGELNGRHVTEPVFGLPATWITMSERENAEIAGFTVVEPPTVLATHLTELLRRNADKLLTRQDVKQLIDTMKKDYAALVEEITNESLPVGTLQKVMQALLREGIPVRDLPVITESLLEYGKVTKNVDVLIEYVRHNLSETIKRLYQDHNGVLHAISVDPQLETLLTNTLQTNPNATTSATLGLPPDVIRMVQQSVANSIDEITFAGYSPLIICSAPIRPYMYRMIHAQFPIVSVVSYSELPPDTDVDIITSISTNPQLAGAGYGALP